MQEPKIFDHYRVCTDARGNLYELGRGSMGVTYLADDPNLQRKVALKVIHAATLNDLQKANFAKEARAAALLRHPNVAAVHHLGASGTHFFYAMEYLDGETAEVWVTKHGPMSPATALNVASQVARALAAAARHGLAHRDIKPSNLMLCTSADGEWPCVKVIDFGLVQPEEESGAVNQFYGTAQYASPEQVLQQPVDVRSDVYSLGCVLWFLLTGAPPFSGSLASIFAQQLNSPLLFDRLPRLPKPTRGLLAQMLDKNPGQRPEPESLPRALQHCFEVAQRKEALAERVVVPLAALAAQNLRPRGIIEQVTAAKSSVGKLFDKRREWGVALTANVRSIRRRLNILSRNETFGRRCAGLMAEGKEWASRYPNSSILLAAAILLVATTVLAAAFLLPSTVVPRPFNSARSSSSTREIGVPVGVLENSNDARIALKEAEPPPPAEGDNQADALAPRSVSFAQSASRAVASAPVVEQPPQQPVTAGPSAQSPKVARAIPVRAAPASNEAPRVLRDGSVLAPFDGVDARGHWVVTVPANSTPEQSTRTIAAKKESPRTAAHSAVKPTTHRPVRHIRRVRRGLIQFVAR